MQRILPREINIDGNQEQKQIKQVPTEPMKDLYPSLEADIPANLNTPAHVPYTYVFSEFKK